MAGKKTSSSKNNDIVSQIKKEMVNYIGPIFEELKVEMKANKAELVDKINWQGTLMEQMNKKFDAALELTEMTHSNNITLNEHSTKIENLEKDIKVLKTV